MPRRTKIVTTLGPATDRDGILEGIIRAGADMVRMNFSHGTPEDHIQRANQVRDIAAKLGRHVAIMGDLQGPKIRVSTFKDGKIYLAIGDKFILDAALGKGEGCQEQVGIDYKSLPQDVVSGDILLLDDGRVQLKVEQVEGTRIHTTVTVAGPLSNNKGINKKGGGLSAPALTEKDKEDIKTAARMNVDYLAVSFPRSGDDLRYARELAREAGSNAKIVAKVERAETVASDEAMEDIILGSDAVMVARGDLGVEIGDPELVGVQKKLIRHSRRLNRVVITATQMMESMINAPLPTRAEVMDVANAVLDGTDAVMLSAESAAGKYPVETVEVMARTCVEAEKSIESKIMNEDVLYSSDDYERVDQAISMAALYAAIHTKVKAVGVLTQTGSSALWVSRFLCGTPIYAITPEEETYNRLALFRDVCPLLMGNATDDHDEMLVRAEVEMLRRGVVQKGDMVIFVFGDVVGMVGSTNSMKIVRVGEHVR